MANMVMAAEGVVAQRTMNLSYPILDSVFIVGFLALLFFKRKYRALIWAVAGGLLYFFVDYVLFHLVAGSRSLVWGAPIDPVEAIAVTDQTALFWVLVWMSLSYGITNFALIWLALERDEHLLSYAALVFLWWIACPQIADLFSTAPVFTIARTTGNYHGIMGIILFVSYAVLIVYNMRVPAYRRVNLLWLLAIGISVQLGWEFSLLVSGIRSDGFSLATALRTLAVNSLTETNLGMPSMYLIFVYLNRALDRKKAQRLGLDPAALMAGKSYAPRIQPQTAIAPAVVVPAVTDLAATENTPDDK